MYVDLPAFFYSFKLPPKQLHIYDIKQSAPNNKPINLDTRCHMRLNRKIKRMEVNRG